MIYDIIKNHNIKIVSEPLGAVHGYYSNIDKNIHVDDSLSDYHRRYVVAYLLYGAIDSPDEMLILNTDIDELIERFQSIRKEFDKSVQHVFKMIRSS